MHNNIFGNSLVADDSQSSQAMDRVQQAQQKKAAVQYEPTWSEVWNTGYTTHTGSFKKGIMQTKLSATDLKKLSEVKEAIEHEVIGTGVESLKKFSKSHALNLYQQLMTIKRESLVKQYIDNMPSNYHLVNTESAFFEMIEQIKQEIEHNRVHALDTETNGVEFVHTTVGLSVSLLSDQHFYVPYGHITDEPQLDKQWVMLHLKAVFTDARAKLVLHNSKFDAHMLLKDGIDIRHNIHADTMIIQHVLNENEDSYALKKLANKYGRYFGYEDESLTFEELFGKNAENFMRADLILATYYACKDTHLTLKLYLWQLSMMDKQPNLKSVYFDIEQPLTPICIDMEDTGFAVDFTFAEQYKAELQQKIEGMSQAIKDAFGDININSSQQLSAVLYDKMGLEDVSKKRSVDAKVLNKLARKCPEVQLILDYREYNKLLTTYIEPLPEKVRPDTKRLCGQFNQSGTVTSRFSSKNPNLQNLPQGARPLFKASDGHYIYGIDYSQIEPRTLASMSLDYGLMRPYAVGEDLYSTLAAATFKMEYEECLEADDNTWRERGLPKHPRKMMKVGLLASMYGISVPSLAESLGITVEEAQQFMDDFYIAYPTMTQWMADTVKFAEEHGYVLTLHGRKRRFIGFQQVAKQYHAAKAVVSRYLGREYTDKDNLWQLDVPRKVKQQFWAVLREYNRVARQAVNAVIQGSAAEIMKIAMVQADRYLKQKGWKMLATIHDEILVEIPDTASEDEVRELEAIMVNAVTLKVPIKCDVEVSKVWGKGVPYKVFLQHGDGAFQ